MPRNRGRRVPKTSKPETLVQNKTHPLIAKAEGDVIVFSFRSAEWLKSIEVKDFTNKYKDADQFAQSQYEIFNNIVPNITRDWKSILARNGQYRHCHLISEEKKGLVDQIHQKIHGYPLGEDVNVYQLGMTGATRLVCIHDPAKQELVPIFVDCNHLLHESTKHNQHDYKSFQYCLVCKNT